ncbi:MAG: peroxiredoxin [Clostridia bacterium]|nr:peroxiredoxin [Clostridia bacterium]
MLDLGVNVPDISLLDQNGERVSLSAFKGEKLLVFFYSKDNTSGCTNQAVGYSNLAGEFLKKGVKIIGISKDSVASHKKFEQAKGLKITLLSDTEKEAILAFDVWHEKKLYGKTSMGVVRTTYLIDESGKIIFANDKVKAALDAEKMLEVV